MVYPNNDVDDSTDPSKNPDGAADPGMITHVPPDHPSRQAMPAPEEVQRLTPNATPSYQTTKLQRVPPTPGVSQTPLGFSDCR